MSIWDDIVDGVGGVVHDTEEAVQYLEHQAAKALLDAIFPASVHAGNMVVKVEKEVQLTTLGIERSAVISAANATSNTVLKGKVSDKVKSGLGKLTDSNFSSVTNSIK